MERDYSKLKGKIIEKYKTQSAFAEAMNLSNRTISLKLKGKIDFNQKDIVKAVELLELDEFEIPIYFFTNKDQNI